MYKFNLDSKGNMDIGFLVPLESGANIPFDVNRIFYNYGVLDGSERGAHACYNTNQVFISVFREAYSYVDRFIRYDFCLPVGSIDTYDVHDVGFVCRNIDNNIVSEIKKEYGECIFITCGKSVSLDSINVRNFNGTIFTTSGIYIVYDDGCRVVSLPVDVLDTQNYIAACDVVIAKAGWGTIAECVLGHSGLVLIERPSAREDSFNIDCVKSRRLGISISEMDLFDIDMFDIKKKLSDSVEYNVLGSYVNDCDSVVNKIISTLGGCI